MAFPDGLVRGSAVENTTRGRSFLFFALGCSRAQASKVHFTLKVPENGLIALNVPLDPLRLGALSTRTTHPFYIARWNELLDILAIPGRVENPYWDQTKGEMTTACAERRAVAAASRRRRCPAHRRPRDAGKVLVHSTAAIAFRA